MNRPLGKSVEQTPDKGNGDIEDLQRMVKKISNEIIDMERSEGEGNQGQRPYKPFIKRATKQTFAENSEEAKMIEFQMKGCKECRPL